MRRKSRSRRGTRSSSDDDSDEDSDGDVNMRDSTRKGKRGKKSRSGDSITEVTLSTMLKAQLTRETICNNIQDKELFKKMYQGAYVLLDITPVGQMDGKKSKIICKITSFDKYKRKYTISWKDAQKIPITTDLCGVLESAGAIKNMALDRVSNKLITAKDLLKFQYLLEQNSLRKTSETEVKRYLMKKKKIKKDSEMAESKKKTNFHEQINFTRAKMDANFEYQDALKKNDTDQISRMKYQLEKIKRKERNHKKNIQKQQTRQTIHTVNVRNVQAGVQRMEYAANLARERAKVEIMDKEFYLHSTRPSRPGILWRAKKSDGNDVPEETENVVEEEEEEEEVMEGDVKKAKKKIDRDGNVVKHNYEKQEDLDVEQNASKALFTVRKKKNNRFCGSKFGCTKLIKKTPTSNN